MFLIQMIQVKIVLRIPHGHLQMEDFTQILLAEEDPIMMNPFPHPLQPLMNPCPHPLPLLLINHFGLNYWVNSASLLLQYIIVLDNIIYGNENKEINTQLHH